MNRFFDQLRNCKVYRVAAAYIVAASFVIQTASVIFPALQIPAWILSAIIIFVLAGFPLALIFGWASDLSERAKTRPANKPINFARRRRIFILLALLGLTISLVTGALILPRIAFGKIDKSIAVLPFDNFTADKENEYFADGVQDDVLTSLARINDLKVISRTSVMHYRGQARNIPEIARALGVSNVLEGSVRRVGQKVRVTVQLIEAAHDRHLWAQTYDRDLTDVFAIQSELAQEIASQLRAKLSPEEAARIQERPTGNNEAYRFYQQAHDIASRPEETLDGLTKAERLYAQATNLDPTFALAFARLSQLQSRIYYLLEPTPQRLTKAKASANEAMRLQPNLPEAHLALGNIYYYGDRDYARAMAEFEIARAGLPNDPAVFLAIGSIERRQGKWEKAIVDLEKAMSLSPTDPDIIENVALTYQAVRDFPAAAKTFDRAIAIIPKSFEANSLRARVDIDWKGDLEPMRKLLANLPPDYESFGTVTLARFNLAFFERNFAEALSILQKSPLDNLHGDTSTPLPKSFLAGQVYRLIPDAAKARASYEEALPIAQHAIEQGPNDPARYALLGLIYAGLGRKDEAIRAGEHASELLPESKDAFDAPILTFALARIYTITGETQKAIDLLEHSVKTPGGTNANELRLDPTWDVLRIEPRFQALIR